MKIPFKRISGAAALSVVLLGMTIVSCTETATTVPTAAATTITAKTATATTTTNGNGTAVDVGTWFVTYNGAGSWANNFGKGFPINYRPLDQYGSYSIPESTDTSLIDFYLAQLTDARIDFLILDETNGGFANTPYFPANFAVIDAAKLVAARLQVWNASHSWKIKYAMAIGGYALMCNPDPFGVCIEDQAQAVVDDFYNVYGAENYYQVDGKPLLVLYDFSATDNAARWTSYTGTKTYGNQFTIRSANSGTPAGSYGWETRDGTQLHPEVEVVMPGWYSHNEGQQAPIGRAQGDYYTNAWNTVLDNPLPKMVVITAFNDYNEDSAIWTADTTTVVEPRTEQWDGHDGQLHPDMYWQMTKRNIVALRLQTNLANGRTATASSSNSSLPASNAVDGNRDTLYSSAAGNAAQHTEWLAVDFGAPKTLDTVSLVARADAVAGFPRDFEVQVWNGSTWLTRATVVDFVQPSPGAVVPISWGFSDYTSGIRILATKLGQDTNGDKVLQLTALEAYNSAEPPTVRQPPVAAPNLALNATPTVSSVYPLWPASNLTDGNRLTAYSSQVQIKSQHTEYIELDLGTPKTLDTITLVGRPYVAYGFPSDFQIQVWNGSEWLTRLTVTNYAVPPAGAIRDFSWGFADYTSKIRLYATGLRPDDNGDYVLQFASVEAYDK
jgi:hypothetical protein